MTEMGRRTLLAVLAGFALAGCASGRRVGAAGFGDLYGAGSAESAVGRFLDAANARDYPGMARLFGTVEGPAEQRWGRPETEQRMFVLAGLLAHRAHAVRPLAVAEVGGGSRWIADMAGTRNGDVSVPFILVSNQGRWFVEQIVTQALTGPWQPVASAGRGTGSDDSDRRPPRTPPAAPNASGLCAESRLPSGVSTSGPPAGAP